MIHENVGLSFHQQYSVTLETRQIRFWRGLCSRSFRETHEALRLRGQLLILALQARVILGTFNNPLSLLAIAKCDRRFMYLFFGVNIILHLQHFICVCLLHFVINENCILLTYSSAIMLISPQQLEHHIKCPQLKKFVHHCVL